MSEEFVNVSLTTYLQCSVYFNNLRDFRPENFSSSNTSNVPLEISAKTFLEECQSINEIQDAAVWFLNFCLCIVMFLGFALNSFVISVLLMDSTKTASDIYLLSISFGDICICSGTFISTQLLRFVDQKSVVLEFMGDVLGHLGKFWNQNIFQIIEWNLL